MDAYQQKLRELAERELDERYDRMQDWESLDEKLRNAQRGKELAEALDDHGAYRLFKSEESLLDENSRDYLMDCLSLMIDERNEDSLLRAFDSYLSVPAEPSSVYLALIEKLEKAKDDSYEAVYDAAASA